MPRPDGSAAPRAPRVVLLSTYDLGHPSFGVASAAAWLARAGFEVVVNDLSVDALDVEALAGASVAAFHVPMHTATRLAIDALETLRALRPDLTVGFFGLYAPMNATLLRARGAAFVVGGEFEERLVRAVERLVASAARAESPGDNGAATPGSDVALDRLAFVTPDRSVLPPLERYARLRIGDEERLAGYTEASRGCRHRCRHCPIVPVYDGRFRIVPREVVLEDVAAQVAAGARHVTFGDPDFWNGIGHARPLVQELHRRFPDLTYDVTIKVEHLRRHAQHLGELKDTGCAFVTSAVESFDDAVLARLDKGHTRADVEEVLARCRAVDLALHPTFVAFTPWTTGSGYAALLEAIADLDLVEHVSPVQLAIRLLVPAGSRLLELPEVRARVGPFDPLRLVHPWRHPDPALDDLQREIEALVGDVVCRGEARGTIFGKVWSLVERRLGRAPRRIDPSALAPPRAPVPFLTEPWYC